MHATAAGAVGRLVAAVPAWVPRWPAPARTARLTTAAAGRRGGGSAPTAVPSQSPPARRRAPAPAPESAPPPPTAPFDAATAPGALEQLLQGGSGGAAGPEGAPSGRASGSGGGAGELVATLRDAKPAVVTALAAGPAWLEPAAVAAAAHAVSIYRAAAANCGDALRADLAAVVAAAAAWLQRAGAARHGDTPGDAAPIASLVCELASSAGGPPVAPTALDAPLRALLAGGAWAVLPRTQLAALLGGVARAYVAHSTAASPTFVALAVAASRGVLLLPPAAAIGQSHSTAPAAPAFPADVPPRDVLGVLLALRLARLRDAATMAAAAALPADRLLGGLAPHELATLAATAVELERGGGAAPSSGPPAAIDALALWRQMGGGSRGGNSHRASPPPLLLPVGALSGVDRSPSVAIVKAVAAEVTAQLLAPPPASGGLCASAAWGLADSATLLRAYSVSGGFAAHGTRVDYLLGHVGDMLAGLGRGTLAARAAAPPAPATTQALRVALQQLRLARNDAPRVDRLVAPTDLAALRTGAEHARPPAGVAFVSSVLARVRALVGSNGDLARVARPAGYPPVDRVLAALRPLLAVEPALGRCVPETGAAVDAAWLAAHVLVYADGAALGLLDRVPGARPPSSDALAGTAAAAATAGVHAALLLAHGDALVGRDSWPTAALDALHAALGYRVVRLPLDGASRLSVDDAALALAAALCEAVGGGK